MPEKKDPNAGKYVKTWDRPTFVCEFHVPCCGCEHPEWHGLCHFKYCPVHNPKWSKMSDERILTDKELT